MTERIVVKGSLGRKISVLVIRARRVRRARIARAMAAGGVPPYAIAASLRMSRRAVDFALRGNRVFDAAMLAAFRDAAEGRR